MGGCFYRLYQGLYGPWGEFGRVDMSRRLLAKPENYKPAAIAMARLLNTDPRLLAADRDKRPPNWTPPEIGRVGPLYIVFSIDVVSMSTTSGLAEFNGYQVERDKANSTIDDDAFVLNFDPLDGSKGRYAFSIPKGEGYTEEELVRGGLAELDRRIAGRATRTDPAITYDVSNPIADRRRLLSQHPQTAKQLGMAVPETAATQPASAQ